VKHLANLFFGAAVFMGPFAAVGALDSDPTPSTSPVEEYAACGDGGVRFLGFSDALNETTFGGFAVSELSALSYDSANGTYKAVADRAGSVRSHTFDLSIGVPGLAAGVPAVTAATVLNTPGGVPYTGANLDAEGLVVRQDGTIFVASEGGSAAGEQPEIHQFGVDGAHLSTVPVPARFLIGTNNLSFESLSESPGGHALFTANEGPLATDGRTADLRSRIRIVRFAQDGAGGFQPAGEFFYLTEPGRTTGDVGVAELLAVSPTSLLVLERGFVAGQGNTIRIFLVSLVGAQDVTEVESLAAEGLVPLAKTLIVDLARCPDGGATIPAGATQANALLDNFEGMTFGPELEGGMRSLILVSDDNGSATQTTRIVLLGVPRLALTPAP
jgi:hypothetical protein